MGKNRKTRNRYPSESKVDAIKRTLEGDVLIKEVAEELNIPPGYLSAWRRDYLASQESGAIEAKSEAIEEQTSQRRAKTGPNGPRKSKKSRGLLCEPKVDHYQFIKRLSEDYPVYHLCRNLEVSESGYSMAQ